MPKKDIEYNKSFNVRITETEYNQWKRVHKESGFSSVAHMIRYCVNSYLDKTLTVNHRNGRFEDYNQRIKLLETNNAELIKSQNELMQLIVKKSDTKADTSFSEYQREVILNLLKEKPRDQIEIAELLTIDEIDVIRIINGFLEAKAIRSYSKDKTKYEVIL